LKRSLLAAAVLAIAATGCARDSVSVPEKPTYLGVYESGSPRSYAAVSAFSKATGAHINLALYYSGWYESFKMDFAEAAFKHGAAPVVQIEPFHVSLSAIAAGHYDKFLRSYALAVRAYGHQVVIGFGHEMNAPWYSWGWSHTKPADFVLAWRHVVQVFRYVGASNVTWLWTINSLGFRVAAPRVWWPGKQYVTWIGIDGYYVTPTDTFASIFGRTITMVRSFTRKPMLISETAVGPAAGQTRSIPDLFAGVERNSLLGLIWFDVKQHGSTYRQDWHLADHPAALAAFRKAAAGVGR
jgi:mannan endo-1,4-beta-mannosidase